MEMVFRILQDTTMDGNYFIFYIKLFFFLNFTQIIYITIVKQKKRVDIFFYNIQISIHCKTNKVFKSFLLHK